MTVLEAGQLRVKINPKAVLSILNDVKAQGKKVLAWKLFGKNKLSLEVRIDKIKKANDEWVIISTESHPAKLNQIITGEETINLFIPSESIMMQATIKEVLGDASLLLVMPQKFAQVERRKHLRLELKEGKEGRNVKVKFKKIFRIGPHERNQSFDKECMDLSAGGISLFINKNEIKFFSMKDEIRKMELILEDKKVIVDAQVVNVIEIDPNTINHLMYKGWKICMKFDRLSKAEEEFINTFVFGKLNINPMTSSER